MGAEPISFGPFVLDRSAQVLLSGGKPIALGQRALALLEALADVDGAVDKAALIDAAWPGVIVEEGNLTVQIAALRKALGPRPDGSEWIITVPRVGYRLVRSAAAAAASRPEAGIPAIIVLPFHNLGGDPEQDYFADGMVDDLITALSRFSSFAVLGRSASFALKGRAIDVRQVAADLGVRYVLEGSVRRAGSRLRITAQLADGGSGAPIWAQQFDGTTEEVFEFQDRIAESTVGIIEPQIQLAELERGRRERPGDITAYDLYLQGLHRFYGSTDADNASAYRLVVRAVDLEPNNARYLVLASEILQHRFGMGWPPLADDDREQARDLTNRAVALAHGDPAILAQAGNVLLQRFKEYDRGLAMIRHAVAANPFSALIATWAGIAEVHCGDLDLALDYFHRAARLNPRARGASVALTGAGHAQAVLGDHEEALIWAGRAYALSPNYDCCLWILAASNAHLGRMDEARRYCEELRLLSPQTTIGSIRAGQPSMIPERIEPILGGLLLAGLPE